MNLMNTAPSIVQTSQPSSWLPYYRMRKGSRLRLFCVPYAGGSASLFHSWSQHMPPGIEVCALQLPGRETRVGEIPFTATQDVTQALSQSLVPYLDKPFILFGHSMGALICFELARQLRRDGLPLPLHLFLSGHRAPQLPPRLPQIHALQHNAFLETLKQFSSIPPDLLRNEDFLRQYLPLLKADFALCENYSYQPEHALSCSISALGGLADDRVNRHELSAWRTQTSAAFALQMFPGDHFFLQSASQQFLSVISQILARFLTVL